MRKPAEILRTEFAVRQGKNSSYSLRAFARDLGVSPATLSQLMNEKRTPSPKSLRAIARKIGTCALELGVATKDLPAKTFERELLREDQFKLISDWSHFAIMNLAKLPNCKADAKWIGKSLNLAPTVVQRTLERLSRLGYIKVHRGRLIRTKQNVATTVDIPSKTIRTHHRQALSNARSALKRIDPKQREFMSLTLDINTDRIPVAKEILRKFINEMSECLQQGRTNEVYTMSMQLFPLSQTGNNDETSS